MPKAEAFQDLALGQPKKKQELWHWLYTELRAAILDGRLKPEGRLPASRVLAKQYGLARGTVAAAFRQLNAEGFTRSETGSGTYVMVPQSIGMKQPSGKGIFSSKHSSRATVSKRALQLFRDTSLLPASHSIGKPFRGYEPAIDLFPVELWARVASRVYRHAPKSLYGQGDPCGYLPLRRAIAEYVGQSRGVRCHPDQIIVTAGAQQALDLIARLLLDPGDRVWMEDPGYPGASQALRAAGGQMVAVPVDDDGLNVAAGRKIAPDARLAYVTPANQFPLGTVMSAERRIELLNWAIRSGSWIIEDEYDAEYRYFGKPVASLQSLDRSGSVIYVGTFTKMLFNALRLGFLVLPERLVDVFAAARSFIDRHPATLDQAVLAEFITLGYFSLHVRKMRQIYSERMAVLSDASRKHLKGILDVEDAPSGMRTVGWIRTGASDKTAARRAAQVGVETIPLSLFTAEHFHKPALILGFAGCSPSEIKRGAAILARALRPSEP